MFNALLDLYKKNTLKTPLERFTSESFRGVLKSDPSLTEQFLYDFAGIENETGFDIYTEEPYKSSFIDIVFENKNCLVFLEIKVNSNEGNRGDSNQLEIYSSILKNQSKKTTLLFCTKFLEIKNSDLYKPIPFNQFLWQDVYYFLNKQKSISKNYLIDSFSNYLLSNSMAKSINFTASNLNDFKNIKNSLEILDECITLVEQIFIEKYFGKPTSNAHLKKSLREIYKYSKYGFIRHHLLKGDKKDSPFTSLYLYIDLSDTDLDNVALIFNFWIDASHPNFSIIIEELKSIKHLLNDAIINETEEEGEIIYKKALNNFLHIPNQILEIGKWYEEKMKIIYTYMTEYSRLEWDVKNQIN